MEDIYKPKNFYASPNFPLNTYFEEFKALFPHAIKEFNAPEDPDMKYVLAMKDLMPDSCLDMKELRHLATTCSIDHLSCEVENQTGGGFPIDLPPNINSSSKLPCPYIKPGTQGLFQTNETKAELEKLRSALQLSMGNKRHYCKPLEFTIPETLPDLKPMDDFVLSVYIYRPFELKNFSSKNSSEKLRFNHEILALGRNTLSELRDKIICPSDEALCKEVQDTSEDITYLKDAKEKYPSGFIFIDSVFYNDFRNPNSIDYSKPIIEWGKQKNLKPFTSRSMENVRLDSLQPRFGYPYLYMHQGDCEHIIIFSDFHLLDETDCLHSQCYPHVWRLNRKVNRTCFMCSITFAKWLCVDSDRFPQSRVLLCTECCNSYNYIDGEKVGNFKLFPLNSLNV